MDDSVRYPEGDTLGKVVSGVADRALGLAGGIWEAEVKGHLRVRTLAPRGPCAPERRAGPRLPPDSRSGQAGLGPGRQGFPAVGQRWSSFGPRLTQELGCTTGSPHQFVLSC